MKSIKLHQAWRAVEALAITALAYSDLYVNMINAR
jgi:hypothetical protein